MLHIVHRAQIGIRSCTAKTGICLELTHEQQLILFNEIKDDNYYRAFRLVK